MDRQTEILVPVMFYDTDCGGVVSNIAYLRFVEQARTALVAALGFSLSKIAAAGEFPAVLRTEIDYKKPAVLGDTVRIEARLEEVKRARFWCGFTLLRDLDGALLGQCRQQCAFVRMPEGIPVPVPAEWREENP
ncbi:MAG: YbgC/YbaW family acyl-CoA thioester hydrolase [Verrucomicrobiales bacterium]|jgi:YbgC/YbaW family acyl-CoA thioester hydrolase